MTRTLANAVVQQRSSGQFKTPLDLLKVKATASQPSRSSRRRRQRAAQSTTNGQTPASQVSEITVHWLAEHMDEMKVNDDERVLGRINVNTAPKAVLMTLPGISEETADAVV
jgi:DNA uptake protein ComE-like DNA-binding protein